MQCNVPPSPCDSYDNDVVLRRTHFCLNNVLFYGLMAVNWLGALTPSVTLAKIKHRIYCDTQIKNLVLRVHEVVGLVRDLKKKKNQKHISKAELFCVFFIPLDWSSFFRQFLSEMSFSRPSSPGKRLCLSNLTPLFCNASFEVSEPELRKP